MLTFERVVGGGERVALHADRLLSAPDEHVLDRVRELARTLDALAAELAYCLAPQVIGEDGGAPLRDGEGWPC